MPYTAFDMIGSMKKAFDLDPVEKPQTSRSIFRFIAAIQGAFSR